MYDIALKYYWMMKNETYEDTEHLPQEIKKEILCIENAISHNKNLFIER